MPTPRRRFSRLASPRFVSFAGLLCVACVLAATVLPRPQGDAPPIAPSAAQWQAAPADAFSYTVTEIRLGDPEKDSSLVITPSSINNKGQVVGVCDRTPAVAPWQRKILDSAFVTRFYAPKQYGTETAFFWDKGRADLLQPLSESPVCTASFINDNGQIAGQAETNPFPAALPFTTPQTTKHAVLWANFQAAPRDVGAVFGPMESHPFGLNAQNNVGVLVIGHDPHPLNPAYAVEGMRPFVWDNGALMPLAPAADGWEAHGLNDKKQSVGGNGTPTLLSPVASPQVLTKLVQKSERAGWSSVYGTINNQNQIAGSDEVDGAFVYQNGRITRLNPVAHRAINERDIVAGQNRTGDVVGCLQKNIGVTGFLWHKNHLYQINDLLGSSPAWVVKEAIALNDRGQMLCVGVPFDPARRIRQTHDRWTDTSTYQHALVLTPVSRMATQTK